MSDVRMIVGLGNPGKEYSKTRHNAGYWAIDKLAEYFGIEVNKTKLGSSVGMGKWLDKRVILVKPKLFMNRSGDAVAQAVRFYKVDLADVLVIGDDMALEVGKVRVRANGSAGGQRGLMDVIEKLGSEEVNRLRIGIGGCGVMDAAKYVLSEPSVEEKKGLDEAVAHAKEAVLCWIELGVEATMNRFN